MRAALGLGSNLGDRRRELERAVAGLGSRGRVLAVSRFLETEPAGGVEQAAFLNAALLLETALRPRELLAETQALEREAGRPPPAQRQRWGPRILDIDILLLDDLRIEEPGLVVPHPHLHERRFALAPLAEIAPTWIVPGCDRTVEELLADLPDDS